MLVWSLGVAVFRFRVKKENVAVIHTDNEVNVEQCFFA